ncbi:MAG: hypothetical protein QG656_1970, partial [Candidatus Hydrogenedentes bacterium]|nr:hypothetical protein [Candidatus Hydrogenedentota bacterium]
EFWVWRFGDGASSGEQSPAHEYNSPGTYTVSLSVYTDYGNDTEEKTALVQVNTLAPPAAAFTASPVQGEPPLTVQFTDASTPGDAPITSWLWHFGDGVTSAEQNPSYTYAESGFYTISLTVTSSAGSNTARKRDYIVVGTPRAKTWLQIYDVAVPFSVVAATPDGGFVAAGVVPSVKADETEGWVVRTDAYGDETWRGPFTCPGTLVLTGIVAVSTGNFILSGIATVYDAELEADTDRGWMCKIDATGEVVWSRTYSEGNREQFNGVAETSDGGLIFAGSIEKPLPETPEDEQREAWLLKTDSQGYKEWSQTYPLEYGSWAYSVQEEPGGGYAAVGEVEIERNVTVVSNALLLRTDASGVLDWAQAIGDTHDAYAVRCTGLADGGYALGGVQGDAPWMAVTDANGTVQWFRALGLDSAGCVFSIQQLLDGGYVVAGANAPGADTAHPGFAAIVNAEGTVTEETTLVENAARMYGVQTCSDGSLIYAGVMEDVPGACLYRLDAATFGE